MWWKKRVKDTWGYCLAVSVCASDLYSNSRAPAAKQLLFFFRGFPHLLCFFFISSLLLFSTSCLEFCLSHVVFFSSCLLHLSHLLQSVHYFASGSFAHCLSALPSLLSSRCELRKWACEFVYVSARVCCSGCKRRTCCLILETGIDYRDYRKGQDKITAHWQQHSGRWPADWRMLLIS